jgi:hypothetical protein
LAERLDIKRVSKKDNWLEGGICKSIGLETRHYNYVSFLGQLLKLNNPTKAEIPFVWLRLRLIAVQLNQASLFQVSDSISEVHLRLFIRSRMCLFPSFHEAIHACREVTC